MRRLAIVVASLAMSAVLPAGKAHAQSPGVTPPAVSWGVDVAASSAYLWRGQTDIAEPSLQPSVWVTLGPVTINSWLSGPDPDSGLRVREHDLTVEYGRQLGSVDVTAGWTHQFLRYAASGRHVHEIFVRASRDGAIRPSIEIAYNLVLGRGTTVIAGAERIVSVAERLRAVTLLSVGYNHHQWIDESLFTHVEGRGSVEWDATPRVTMRPYLAWSRSLNRSVFPSRVHGGVELSITGRP